VAGGAPVSCCAAAWVGGLEDTVFPLLGWCVDVLELGFGGIV